LLNAEFYKITIFLLTILQKVHQENQLLYEDIGWSTLFLVNLPKQVLFLFILTNVPGIATVAALPAGWTRAGG
jgi:hypothetical protein